MAGPLVPRRRLAKELRRLREEAGLSLADVARSLEVSTSKLSRLENAQGSPKFSDVKVLAELYGVANTALGEKLLRWARDGRRQGWWAQYSHVLFANTDTYLAFESEASISRVFMNCVVPGLLQTPEYARELIKAMEPELSSDEIDRVVELRQFRQKFLDDRERVGPLEIQAVMYETCLLQVVGSREIMHEQLTLMAGYVSRNNVKIRILPFTAEPHLMITCPFTHFEFSDSLDRDVAQIESHAGFYTLESEGDVKRYLRAFESLARRSMTVEESAAYISTVAREHYARNLTKEEG